MRFCNRCGIDTDRELCTDCDELLNGVRIPYREGRVYSAGGWDVGVHPDKLMREARELEVWNLANDGLSDRGVARILGISENSVYRYRVRMGIPNYKRRLRDQTRRSDSASGEREPNSLPTESGEVLEMVSRI